MKDKAKRMGSIRKGNRKELAEREEVGKEGVETD